MLIRTSPSTPSRALRLMIMATLLALGAVAVGGGNVLAAPLTFQGMDCNNNSWMVSNEVELNEAIGCYNGKTTGGTYTITVSQDIPLATSTTAIDNATAGVELTIEGGGFAVDGQDTAGVRVFEVAYNTTVTMNDLTVTGGNFPGVGGGIQNNGTLTIADSTISGNAAPGFGGFGGGINNGGALTVSRSTISGNTAGNDGGGIHSNGALTVNESTISGNHASTGGGIYSNVPGTTVAITNSTIEGNSAQFGGGILNFGGLITVSNSTISDNTGSSFGGGISNSDDLILDSTTLTGNTSGGGGALYNENPPAHATVKNSILANSVGTVDCMNFGGATIVVVGDNLVESQSDCGFTLGPDPLLGPLADNGGHTRTHELLPGSPAVNAGDTDLTTDQRGEPRPDGPADDIGAYERQDCGPGDSWPVSDEVELNEAIGCYNGKSMPGTYTITVTQNISLTASTTIIFNAIAGIDLVIEGGGFTVDGQGISGVKPFNSQGFQHVTMNDLTVTGGNSTAGAGGIYNSAFLTLNNSTVTGNMAATGGGGIRNDGTLTLNNSAVSDNTSGGFGGGIFNVGTLAVDQSTVSGNHSGSNGGGIYNSVAGGISVEVTNSTISDNSANSGVGGGIINTGGSSSSMSLGNSTISGNTANFAGGGIYNARILSLDSVTINANTAGNGGGLYNTTNATVKNSILANSVGSVDCVNASGGSIIIVGANLVETQDNCGFTLGSDPDLGPLADNGGPTQTHALLPGSPAIDAGETDLTTDQRGEPRPAGSADDIGAYEEQFCHGTGWLVQNEAELNTAIACFNGQTTPGTYTITVSQEIPLAASTTAIDNATAGVELTIEGGGYAVDGQDTAGVRVFEVAYNTTVTVNDLTVTGGNFPGVGGGIQNNGSLTIVDSTISDNAAPGFGGFGGGINNGGALAVTRSTISGNTAGNDGGGIHNNGALTVDESTIADNHSRSAGGGIYSNVSGIPVAVTNSTITGNSAQFGGGIHNTGNSLTVSNSTISGNIGSSFGGGIYNDWILSLDSTTITGNTSGGGGALYNENAAAHATVKNSILANSGGTMDCVNTSGGSIISAGANLVESQSDCGFTLGPDPLLGPLQDNGGPTETHALLVSSPAIDAGETDLTSDQRGEARPAGPADDIGAYEFHCTTPAATAVSISQAGMQVQLDWSDVPDSSEYNVYRSSNAPYFTPAPPPYAGAASSPWLDPDTTAIGDAANNYFYVVQTANACGGTADSNRVGEFDFTLVPGTP